VVAEVGEDGHRKDRTGYQTGPRPGHASSSALLAVTSGAVLHRVHETFGRSDAELIPVSVAGQGRPGRGSRARVSS
jgi:hypothetical protein